MTPHPVVLIVDDEPDSADLLGVVLGLYFPEVVVLVAHGSAAALDLASRQRPDAAVLDLEMPGMNGEALAFALRNTFVEAAPLLVALSGNVARLAAIHGNGTFDHQLSKPADIDNLVRLLTPRLSASGPLTDG